MLKQIRFTFSTEALLQKLKTKSTITLSRDNYQLELALLIQRDPIFLKYSALEMEAKKYRYQIEKKYNILPKFPKDMYDFQMISSANENGEDDTPTHIRMIGDERTLFRENSKQFKFVDPNTSDNHSIQYNGLYTTYLLIKQQNQWQFPTISIEDKTTFQETKDKLFKQLSNNRWEIFYFDRQPRCMQTIEQPIENSKILGKKIFYFQAKHVQGKVYLNPDQCQDYAWVTRLEMNKFLTEKDYNDIIHSLDL